MVVNTQAHENKIFFLPSGNMYVDGMCLSVFLWLQIL